MYIVRVLMYKHSIGNSESKFIESNYLNSGFYSKSKLYHEVVVVGVFSLGYSTPYVSFVCPLKISTFMLHNKRQNIVE